MSKEIAYRIYNKRLDRFITDLIDSPKTVKSLITKEIKFYKIYGSRMSHINRPEDMEVQMVEISVVKKQGIGTFYPKYAQYAPPLEKLATRLNDE